jgi:glycosyltransferase involved in cell wall biosynthesis
MVAPDVIEFVLLSFEGPDIYAQAGGLGVRMRELSRALAGTGYRTHLFFVGDPAKPGLEIQEDGRLILHRWCQWVSQYYPGGVYQGEEQKLAEWNRSLPSYIVTEVALPAIMAGRRLVIMGEDWQTAASMNLISDALYFRGIREHAIMLWNANSTYGFWRINWGALGFVATITTVSRYMKHQMWGQGVNPIVIPNGIPERMLTAVDAEASQAVRRALGGDIVLFKIGRFDPDKRWLMAVAAVAAMKQMGLWVRLLMRGGLEPHGAEVLATAAQLGLRVASIGAATLADLCAAIEAEPEADLLNITTFLPDEALPPIYAGVDAVLANSGHEPFGLVGLEVMASGGLVFTGSSGEDYAQPHHNAMVLDTDDPLEIVAGVRYLQAHPEHASAIRQAGYATAQQYTWAAALEILFEKLDYLGLKGGMQ